MQRDSTNPRGEWTLSRTEIGTGCCGVAHRARRVLAGRRGGVACRAEIPQRLAGLLALSSYLPFPETLAAGEVGGNADVPILMCHGRMDPVVPIGMGPRRATCSGAGYAVEWHEYPMQHEVCAEELVVIGRWLRARLAGAAG